MAVEPEAIHGEGLHAILTEAQPGKADGDRCFIAVVGGDLGRRGDNQVIQRDQATLRGRIEHDARKFDRDVLTAFLRQQIVALEAADLKIDDIDVIELNEAFASRLAVFDDFHWRAKLQLGDAHTIFIERLNAHGN